MTNLLAAVFGIYMIVAGLGLVFNKSMAARILDDFENKPALCYMGGAIIHMLGVALILTHNIWTGWPEIMITLFGWGAAIEGALLLIYPKALFGFARKIMPSETFVPAFGVFAIILGAALLGL